MRCDVAGAILTPFAGLPALPNASPAVQDTKPWRYRPSYDDEYYLWLEEEFESDQTPYSTATHILTGPVSTARLTAPAFLRFAAALASSRVLAQLVDMVVEASRQRQDEARYGVSCCWWWRW